MRTIGVFGTAKNTGKTTTVRALLASTLDRGNSVALTSIGYDGEHFDNVTRLPKPRYLVPAGVFIATAEKALSGCQDYQLIKATGIHSALGKILIIRVQKPGYYVLAGPTQGRTLKEVLQKFDELGVAYTFVDGALNRLVPLAAADGLVLATGAAKTPDLGRLVQETQALCALFGLPAVHCTMPETVALANEACSASFPFKSILVAEDMDRVAKGLRKCGYGRLYIPGIMTFSLLEALIRDCERLEIIFSDITRVLVAGDVHSILKLYEDSKGRITFSVHKKTPLFGVTVNPSYPLYRHDFNDYQASSIDGDLLLREMRGALNIPVVDIYKSGGSELLDVIENKVRRIM